MGESGDPYGIGAGWSRSRLAFLGTSTVLLLLLLWWASNVLLPFVLALIIAYVLTPPVAYVERWRVPRALAIVLVYAVTLSSLYFSIAAMAPRVYAEAKDLAIETPNIARQLAATWGPELESRLNDFLDRDRVAEEPDSKDRAAFQIQELEDGGYAVRLDRGVDIVQEGPRHWRIEPLSSKSRAPSTVSQIVDDSITGFTKYVKSNLIEFIRVGQVIVSSVSRGIFLVFMTLMVAGYLMYTHESIIQFFRDLFPPASRASFDHLLHRIDRGLSGVVRGQLLICAVNGVLSAIGFIVFDLKYWPILAIIAGVMSIIPIFGSILSTIPAVLIGLTQDFWTALWVLLWILVIHQVEANLLNPKIIGVAAKLHPVLVIFALIVGEHTYGLWGALLAVPALSVAQSLFNYFRYELMPDVPPDSVAIESRRPPPMPDA